MKVYRVDEHSIEKPSKFIEHSDGYEMISNDGEVKVCLLHSTLMEGSIDSDFYYTVTWILEDVGWVRANNTSNYKTKEEFIEAISNSEDFTQAVSELRKD